MSYEAWGDGDEDHPFTEDRVEEIAKDAFTFGILICREMMARFVEQGGDKVTAQSIRLNWNPAWGEDFQAPEPQHYDEVMKGYDPWRWL